ncbi:MAG TPA: glutamate--cysteine ligase [Alphaproteobacteria bacterium]|nr:glutamate--cysteine ligase [Alphaproteobacteria bacterium]
MSAPPKSSGAPITDRRQLVEYFAAGCKPRAAWRIGTEHEKFAFRLDDLRSLPYEGERASIRALLEGMTRFDWQPVYEGERPIALARENCSVTLEPGGQVELSGAPVETIHQTCDEVHQHLAEVKAVAGELGAGLLGMGFNPKWSRADTPQMPKGRYAIMRAYMPKKGNLGLDMMHRTCTVQVNLDFDSEADMVRKFRVSLALQPVATALFADSPFSEGKPNGHLSWRSRIWTDTDPDRCGMLPFVFEPGMGFERYLDYILDVPMYFVYRDGRYVDVAGRSFRDFLAGRLAGFEGQLPTIGDFADHVTTAFPEVRLKRYLELRGADGGPWSRLCALPALWVGLLYDAESLDQAAELVKDWTIEDMRNLRRDVPWLALKAPIRGGTVQDVAKQVVALARDGLRRRARRDRAGASDESHFLDVLTEIAESGRTPAEEKLERYHGVWGRSVDAIFREYAY